MRVAMVILEYLPLPGGAQRQLAAVAPLLARRGVEVHVLTRRAPGLPREERIGDSRVHRLPAPGVRATASLGFTAAALSRLSALRPDVVHAFSLFSPATIAVLARRRQGVPTLVKVLRGGSAGDVERLRAKPLAAARISELRRSIDAFVSISDEIDAELDELGISPEKRHRIPNGVDTERFRPVAAAERRALRHRLALPDAPMAVYCGRLVSEKRVSTLLGVWDSVRRRVPEATLVIVGAGPEAPTLARQAGAGVRFAGAAQDVLPYLQAADAFVLPSATEGLSNAMLEAMAVGLPVVATRVGAAEEVIPDAHTGTLVPPEDATAIGDALARVLGDPERARQGLRGRARVEDAFALPAVADRLAGLYEELAGARSVRPAGPRRVAPREVRA